MVAATTIAIGAGIATLTTLGIVLGVGFGMDKCSPNPCPGSSACSKAFFSYTCATNTTLAPITTAAETTAAVTTAAVITDTTAGAAVYTDWSDWTDCSATCGDGTRTHTRTCTDNCPESPVLSESENCNEQSCEWSDWGSCTRECSGGTQTRTKEGVADAEQDCNPDSCLNNLVVAAVESSAAGKVYQGTSSGTGDFTYTDKWGLSGMDSVAYGKETSALFDTVWAISSTNVVTSSDANIGTLGATEINGKASGLAWTKLDNSLLVWTDTVLFKLSGATFTTVETALTSDTASGDGPTISSAQYCPLLDKIIVVEANTQGQKYYLVDNASPFAVTKVSTAELGFSARSIMCSKKFIFAISENGPEEGGFATNILQSAVKKGETWSLVDLYWFTTPNPAGWELESFSVYSGSDGTGSDSVIAKQSGVDNFKITNSAGGSYTDVVSVSGSTGFDTLVAA